ncbi:MAG: hypothetical protein IPK06_04405 [Ignavibacteriae bacterium]|nr:hypothetical protein [Ignavibacteriota bacterium]
MTLEEKKENAEWIRWVILLVINVMIIVSSVILAYGSLDKRVTVLETRQEKNIDGEELQKQLKAWKNEIIEQMKEEISRLQK